ncbi:MAG: response regulator [Mesorhizobium sp.]|uniref:response regulator n=1 Tax=Mesorhizobium sp. M7A.F.Ca.ET.027.02.1.1 TaxID=2496655 RepID=UPI000FD52EA4|nr:response regulator [Mesorhizobium sp. M7A.F.Ca.ET.027.02.1.1]RVD17818.1 response regulator [Mesorhizobium sp. M7A.F.Ca.ET.027.02.1.1]RWD09810.1 MAG: response regulator [Mesorhizobium sp.]
MTTVVFEDDDRKFNEISAVLISKGIKESAIRRCSNMAEFSSLRSIDIDLCIIDIRMPGIRGGDTRNAGIEILQMLDYSGLQRIPVLAITAYPEEAQIDAERFLARGCIIYDYDRKETWQQALDIFLAQARDRGRYDFIIFAALEKERDAFLSDPKFRIDSVSRYGINHWECDLDGKSGSIVLLPRAGLVVAATVVSRVLTQYTPLVAAMAGICAGIGDSTPLGQLLVADVCWEYQSGKWLKDSFEAEPYQVDMHPDTRASFVKILEDRGLLKTLEKNYTGRYRPDEASKPKLAVFTTGSAVIASADRLKHVQIQHRKVSGLDMEVFGFMQAVEISNHRIHAFSAKTVVDKADESKGDRLHEYGCYLAAQFCLRAISDLLK